MQDFWNALFSATHAKAVIDLSPTPVVARTAMDRGAQYTAFCACPAFLEWLSGLVDEKALEQLASSFMPFRLVREKGLHVLPSVVEPRLVADQKKVMWYDAQLAEAVRNTFTEKFEELEEKKENMGEDEAKIFQSNP